ncbi:zeaxanthin glucosyltransferase [Pseudomonas syringae]|uniref:Glycosyltransferase, MGT family n=1 Tax=Pseudomonas syringae TaxID=317 RepID=A0AB37ZUF6_PSESX|nr:nucleotide disphospho-sugar-binding domain-containing protein [Pseudomonas syringae]MBI6669652.1 glycosyltransferase [Pseudomonas syringae]MBI6679663.1 glycosyltransferase [Pseudomonas syringae]MBI6839635.1 glycosyltransferase [Pseudomonas syringae]NAP22214.1 glycosyltransferase [Pseudomonas syringae]NAQ17823.1 glycosyltransferase [Pseudomonas syringae]
MSHLGVVAPAFYSHFKAFQALATELIERGHKVTFFQQTDARRWLTDSRIGFHAVGATSHPPGSLERVLRRAAASNNPWRLQGVIRDLCASTRMLCAELPGALNQRGIDALLCDQMEAGGGLVAEALGLPFISVACALPVNREPQIPLAVMPFAYKVDERSRRIYQGSQQVYDLLMRPLGRVIHEACRRFSIAPREGLHQCLSPYAQISQTIQGFDLPRTCLPENFHAVGPLRTPDEPLADDWDIDPARPFVFASLGTLQGGRMSIFRQVAKACARLDAQLLIAHCGGIDQEQEGRLKKLGATWVTGFAAQQWVLQKANAVVTHGGLNTVMDAIKAITPMLVMPIGFDQPGVAARVSHAGAGQQLNRRARAEKIHAALVQLLDHPVEPLHRLARELEQAGGTQRAADIVETVIRTRNPVLAGNAS